MSEAEQARMLEEMRKLDAGDQNFMLGVMAGLVAKTGGKSNAADDAGRGDAQGGAGQES